MINVIEFALSNTIIMITISNVEGVITDATIVMDLRTINALLVILGMN